jgi:hypothetical protein
MSLKAVIRRYRFQQGCKRFAYKAKKVAGPVLGFACGAVVGCMVVKKG